MPLTQLLERISREDFETLSEDIKGSISAHNHWMRQINLALVTRTPIQSNAFTAQDSHLQCKFGHWINSLLKDEAFHQDAFLKIDELHKRLHNDARELLSQLTLDGSIDAQKYQEFSLIQKDFFAEVLLIFEFSVVNRHQFDTTTNLMNRRTVDTVLAHEKHRMARFDESSCCIALADIDYFKLFNDSYGHDVGDKALENAAAVFHDGIRRHDTVARFGGEEFLFVLPDMDLSEGIAIIERVRKDLEQTSISHNGKQLSITASFGITQLCRRCNIKDSIKRADIALYHAKDSGRNCSVSVDADQISQALGLEGYDRDEQFKMDLTQQYCRLL